jgi:hypothetical protein
MLQSKIVQVPGAHAVQVVVLAAALLSLSWSLPASRTGTPPSAPVGISEEVRRQDVRFLVDVEPQSTDTRDVQPVAFEAAWRYEDVSDDEFYNPIRLVAHDDGSVHVLDYGDRLVKHIAASGERLASYGEGEGRGPGEATRPTGLAITPSGQVWVSDIGSGRLNGFDASGAYAATIRSGPAWRVSALDDERFVIFPADSHVHLIRVLDRQGTELAASSPLVDRQEHFYMALSGDVQVTPSGDIVYVTKYSGHIFCFTDQAELKYARAFVDPPPFPAIKEQTFSGGGRSVGLYYDELDDLVQGFDVTEDAVHVLRQQRDRAGSWSAMVDVYRLRDGAYVRSYEPPFGGAKGIDLVGTRLYALFDTDLAMWRRM